LRKKGRYVVYPGNPLLENKVVFCTCIFFFFTLFFIIIFPDFPLAVHQEEGQQAGSQSDAGGAGLQHALCSQARYGYL
jgi:hypothetical protein